MRLKPQLYGLNQLCCGTTTTLTGSANSFEADDLVAEWAKFRQFGAALYRFWLLIV
jgi:hypothetical protein